MNLVDTVSLRAIATAEDADIVVGVLLPGTKGMRINQLSRRFTVAEHPERSGGVFPAT